MSRDLILRHVSKSYVGPTGPNVVIEDIDLSIAEGEFVSVVGPSGSGKTTLLSIAAGLVETDAGEVLAHGRPVIGPGAERTVIFQQYAVFPWLTVRQNIEFGLRLAGRRADGATRRRVSDHYIDLMGLRGHEDAWPKTLSGGQKQRVAIARAYAVNPEILLMDEPFAALDAQTRDHMQDVLLEILLQERRSVMFITHSVEEALFLSNRVVVLGGRPARIRQIIDVPWPYPRIGIDTKTRLDFVELRRTVELLLGGDRDR